MYNITPQEKEFLELLLRDKDLLESNFEKSIKKIENTLNIFADPNNLSQLFSLEKNIYFWNTARYINIISLDLKILSKHQAFANSEWEKRLFARQISLLIYESLDDILFLLGKEFKQIADEYKSDNAFNTELNELRNRLNDFKKKYFEMLKKHRNTSIAHREKDTNAQLHTIYSISWIQSVNISSEFDRILNDIGHFLEKIMKKGVSDNGITFNAY